MGDEHHADLYPIAVAVAVGAGATVTQANIAPGIYYDLFIKVSAATNISVEISPDGGTSYNLGNVAVFGAAGDDVVSFSSKFNWIRITTSGAVTWTLQLRVTM